MEEDFDLSYQFFIGEAVEFIKLALGLDGVGDDVARLDGRAPAEHILVENRGNWVHLISRDHWPGLAL